MPPIADVHGNPAKLGLEHGVAEVSLHVVSGLKKKITNKELRVGASAWKHFCFR